MQLLGFIRLWRGLCSRKPRLVCRDARVEITTTEFLRLLYQVHREGFKDGRASVLLEQDPQSVCRIMEVFLDASQQSSR